MISIKINYVRDELIGDNGRISIEVPPSFPKDTDIDTIKKEIRVGIERHISNRISGVPDSVANTQEDVEVDV